MVFGLVLGFLEGRRDTEARMAGLCASFILADGATKSVGTWLLQQGVSERWMPATAGLMFVPPLLFFVWMLTRIPPPDEQDVALRSQRSPMSRSRASRDVAPPRRGRVPDRARLSAGDDRAQHSCRLRTRDLAVAGNDRGAEHVREFGSPGRDRGPDRQQPERRSSSTTGVRSSRESALRSPAAR